MNGPLLLLLLSSIAAGQTGSINKSVLDYRFKNRHGNLQWCVYCTQHDIEEFGYETDCMDKKLPEESRIINGQKVKFWAFCDSLHSAKSRPRYIKNCTAAPKIEGAEVECRDRYGNEHFRVHDTCSVTCTGSRMAASELRTTCDPRTGNWTEVNCKADRCPPLKDNMVPGQENTTCDVNKELPLNSSCEVSCPVGYEPATRVLECLDGSWTALKTCSERLPSGCPPLKYNMVLGQENTTCDVNKKLPLNTSCEVSCPIGYEPATRVLGCLKGSWTPLKTCSEPLPSDFNHVWLIAVIAVLGAVVIALMVVFVCWRCKQTGTIEEKKKKAEEISLVESRSSVSSELLRGSQGSDDTREDTISEVSDLSGLLAENTPPDDSTSPEDTPTPSCNVQPPRYSLVVHDNYQGASSTACVEIRYQTSDGVSGRCDVQRNHVTANPEDTQVKVIVDGTEGCESLGGTVSEASMTAFSKPSKPSQTEAEPISLPSEPNLSSLLMGSRGSISRDDLGGADGTVGGEIAAVVYRGGRQNPRLNRNASKSTASLISQISNTDEDDSLLEGCTLPLVTIVNDRRYKKNMKKLCLALEPLTERHPDLTIHGVALTILETSRDEVDHVIWAKREDLRNSPAHILLCQMMQAGKRAAHLVRYFANKSHRHVGIIQNLKAAHPDCPVCRRYS